MNPNLTQEYRTTLTLSDCRVTIVALNEDQTRKQIDKLLPGATYKEHDNQTILVFHPKFADGKSPCGWSSRINVPSGFDVKSISEQLLERAVA